MLINTGSIRVVQSTPIEISGWENAQEYIVFCETHSGSLCLSAQRKHYQVLKRLSLVQACSIGLFALPLCTYSNASEL